VSDFGLTKFKEEMNRNTAKEIQGSVHWTAPEILNEAIDIDFMVADIYSFGIILWELMTRQQPYMGMRYARFSLSLQFCHPNSGPDGWWWWCDDRVSVRRRWRWRC
jgi:serine/threonine protein kinase